MRHSTACFLVKESEKTEVLLGLKKIGFGAGKYAGIGGKVEAGETIQEAAIREVHEEIGVEIPENCIEFMGMVTFLFPSKVEWNQDVFLFITNSWQGEPRESNEMRPSWFTYEDIPYYLMWQDAIHWLPKILEGSKIRLTISFKDDNETVDQVFQG